MEKCDECGRVIGNGETACIHDGNRVVCQHCKSKLSRPATHTRGNLR